MEALKKKERVQTQVLKWLEEELVELRSETTDRVSEMCRGLDGVRKELEEVRAEWAEEESEDGENGGTGAGNSGGDSRDGECWPCRVREIECERRG